MARRLNLGIPILAMALGACSFTQQKPVAMAKPCMDLAAMSQSLYSKYAVTPAIIMRTSEGNPLIEYLNHFGMYVFVEVTSDKCAKEISRGAVEFVSKPRQRM